LDIVDPQTKKLIWRGTAKDAVNLSWSQQRKTAKISEAVSWASAGSATIAAISQRQ